MYKSFRLIQDGKFENLDFFFEKNFPIDINVEKLKERIEIIVGIPKDDLKLDLCHNDGSLVTHLNDPNKLIKDYYDFSNVVQMTLKILSDKNSILEEFSTSNLGNVSAGDVLEEDINTRYKIPDEEYDKRTRNYSKIEKISNIDQETIIKRFYVNQKCVVKSPGKSDRNGIIRYIGIPPDTEEYRIGVEFDYHLGLHDGNFNGQYLFKCEPKKGSYILPEFVFPLESIQNNDEIDQNNETIQNDDLEEF